MPSLVVTANEVVPIEKACVWARVEVPGDLTYDRPSQKLRCPFGAVWHDDQGVEAAFRIYPSSNSVYCFAGCGYFRPVGLCALAWDRDDESTALELLRRVSYQFPDAESQWRAQVNRKPEIDKSQLEAAFKVYCSRRLDNWPDCQYTEESGVSRFLSSCLRLLYEHVETPEQAQTWRVGAWRAVDQFAVKQKAGARRSR